MNKGIVLILILFLISCKSAYQFTPNGFIVEGDDYFINVDRKLSLYVGLQFSNRANLPNAKLQNIRLSRNDLQIIKKLGYKAENYTILFSAEQQGDSSFRLLSLINNKPKVLFESNRSLVSRAGFSIRETKEAKYYYQKEDSHGELIYHAIVPFKQPSGQEEYVSLIYIVKKKDFKNFDFIEDLAISNAVHYKNGYEFMANRTEIGCPDDGSRGHLDYRFPEQFLSKKYSLLKGYVKSDEGRKLAIYRLLSPGQYYGSFVVCEGNYDIDVTDLQHRLIWRQSVVVAADPVNVN